MRFRAGKSSFRSCNGPRGEKVIFRKDYVPPAYLIPEIRLEVDLGEASTTVQSWMRVVSNVDSQAPKGNAR
jgi:hypothetical protein